jgi:hypothetical protein
VTSCFDEDFSPQNRALFRIDDYLAEFATQFGAPNNFPQVFVDNQLVGEALTDDNTWRVPASRIRRCTTVN